MPQKNRRPKKGSKGSKANATENNPSNDAQKGGISEENAVATAADRLAEYGIIATFAQSSKTLHPNARDINVSNLSISFHGAIIIEETDLILNYGNRYGFVGPNGSGKSTIMKAIGARAFPIPDGIDIYHLTEEIEASDKSAVIAVMEADEQRYILEAEAEKLNAIVTEAADGDDPDEAVLERLTQIYERLDELDAAMAEIRARKILYGLGFTPEMQEKKTREFSGGWRMRIALARALFLQPELLLLDEPTNHLDMEAVVWLEEYLAKWNKILFLVSHSQDFMNNVCTHICNLHKRKLDYYTGNYDSYVQTRTEMESQQMKRYNWEQDEIKKMKEYIAKFGHGSAKLARQAQSKEKTLEKMMRSGLTERVETDHILNFKFPDPGHIPPPVLQCQNITFGYPGCPILYENVEFGVDLDSRVALVGPNGAGKSTLLKVISGQLMPTIGDVRPHSHLKISMFTQHFVDVLDLEQTPLDYMRHCYPDMSREEHRKFLGRYGTSGSVQTQVMKHLSDGQKTRVVFAKIAMEAPHILLLDEPTNHLDMESIDSLARAINDFKGGVLLVSHDMRLISQVAQEIWLCENRAISKYEGVIDDFKMNLRRQMTKQLAARYGSTPWQTPASTPQASPAVPSGKKSFPALGSGISKPSSGGGGGGGGGISLPTPSAFKQPKPPSPPSSSSTSPSSSPSSSPGSGRGTPKKQYVPPHKRSSERSNGDGEAASTTSGSTENTTATGGAGSSTSTATAGIENGVEKVVLEDNDAVDWEKNA